MIKLLMKTGLPTYVLSILVVILGVGVGFGLSRNASHQTSSTNQKTGSVKVVNSQDEAGVADESVFKDSEAPIGILGEGGINGEGMYHLERPGGKSQTVYLTSTVIDLKPFVGKKVQVWGQTLSGQKAGWLMDVGKVKVTQ